MFNPIIIIRQDDFTKFWWLLSVENESFGSISTEDGLAFSTEPILSSDTDTRELTEPTETLTERTELSERTETFNTLVQVRENMYSFLSFVLFMFIFYRRFFYFFYNFIINFLSCNKNAYNHHPVHNWLFMSGWCVREGGRGRVMTPNLMQI